MAFEPRVAVCPEESCQKCAGRKNEQESNGTEDGMSDDNSLGWAQAYGGKRGGGGAGRRDCVSQIQCEFPHVQVLLERSIRRRGTGCAGSKCPNDLLPGVRIGL